MDLYATVSTCDSPYRLQSSVNDLFDLFFLPSCYHLLSWVPLALCPDLPSPKKCHPLQEASPLPLISLGRSL